MLEEKGGLIEDLGDEYEPEDDELEDDDELENDDELEDEDEDGGPETCRHYAGVPGQEGQVCEDCAQEDDDELEDDDDDDEPDDGAA
jgi:hypothetical protein